VQWTRDGRSLRVHDLSTPARVSDIDLATGRRTVVRELAPPAVATGVRGLLRFTTTMDGRAYAATWLQFDSSLYLVKGLR
jgi:hypothetical protein